MRTFYYYEEVKPNTLRIDSGTIGMESARLYKSSRTVLSGTGTDVSGSMTGSQLTSSFDQFLSEQKSQSEALKAKENLEEPFNPYEGFNPLETARSILSPSIRVTSPTLSLRTSASDKFQKLHEEFIRNLIELLSGRRTREKNCDNEIQSLPAQQNYEVVKTTDYFSMTYEESQVTSFQATGNVKTEDGREFNINLNIKMSSTFVSTYNESVSYMSYQLTDPLVINLTDMPAELTDATYYFDIDSDGEKEELAGLSGNSGFLALDKNNDGIINDGSELFGTKSGDGFKDLSEYDSDHNGWIDENDAVFEMLKIWVKDSEGNDILFSLKDKNVGAIYLGNADTEFSINNTNHDTLGVIRKTGVFLYETGETGTVQHVDLVS